MDYSADTKKERTHEEIIEQGKKAVISSILSNKMRDKQKKRSLRLGKEYTKRLRIDCQLIKGSEEPFFMRIL